MTDYADYTTKQGERWDTIAYNCYGNQFLYSTIIEANPQYRSLALLSGGTVLRVPILEDTAIASVVASEDLPPWKR